MYTHLTVWFLLRQCTLLADSMLLNPSPATTGAMLDNMREATRLLEEVLADEKHKPKSDKRVSDLRARRRRQMIHAAFQGLDPLARLAAMIKPPPPAA